MKQIMLQGCWVALSIAVFSAKCTDYRSTTSEQKYLVCFMFHLCVLTWISVFSLLVLNLISLPWLSFCNNWQTRVLEKIVLILETLGMCETDRLNHSVSSTAIPSLQKECFDNQISRPKQDVTAHAGQAPVSDTLPSFEPSLSIRNLFCWYRCPFSIWWYPQCACDFH